MWRWNTRTNAFFGGSSRKVGEPARAGCGSDLDFQVTAEKCRDCDGLKVLSWTEGVQGAVVHQLCRLRPLCKAAASEPESRRLGFRWAWAGWAAACPTSDSATLTMYFSRVIPPPPFFTGRRADFHLSLDDASWRYDRVTLLFRMQFRHLVQLELWYNYADGRYCTKAHKSQDWTNILYT